MESMQAEGAGGGLSLQRTGDAQKPAQARRDSELQIARATRLNIFTLFLILLS